MGRFEQSRAQQLSALESLAGRITTQVDRRHRETQRSREALTARTIVGILEDVFAHEDECTLNIVYNRNAATVDLAGAARRKYIVRRGLFSHQEIDDGGAPARRGLDSRAFRTA
jgi:hypothetical protein